MTARPLLVADGAIAHLDEAFGDVAEIRRVRGDALTGAELSGASALLVRSVTRVDAALVAGSALRFVGSATAGVDHIDRSALAAANIAFAHAPGCNAQAVVEYVLSATLGHGSLRGPVGVVGYGAIGRRLTAALRTLGVEVWVNDPPLEDAGFSGPHLRPLAELLRGCKTLSFHVPRRVTGPHRTRHLLDASGFAQLQADALIINTSRGDVVDNAALQAWLNDSDGSAVLDVWEDEPALRWPLLQCSGLRLATPHIAGYTKEGKARATAMMHTAYCNAMNVPGAKGSFDPSTILGTPGRAPLDASVQTLAACLRAVHPLHRTDAHLRTLATVPVQARGSAFEQQRRDYVFRRELSHFRPPTPSGWPGGWPAPTQDPRS